jgi:hypothetical protein
VRAFAAGVVTTGAGLIEQELAPDTGRAEVLPDSPCLAQLVDEQQPEAAWGFGVGREHARCQARAWVGDGDSNSIIERRHLHGQRSARADVCVDHAVGNELTDEERSI